MNLETYISELSKYIIAIIGVFYTLECFLVFRFRAEEKRKLACVRMNILMFAFHFSCFMVICFETSDVRFLIFYALQQVLLYAVIVLYRTLYPKTSGLIINNMCMLLSVGFVILTRLSFAKAVRQYVIVGVSLIFAIIIPFFVRNIKLVKNLKWIYAILGIVALGVILVLGQTTYGSHISYTIGGLTFQPAEFVKIVFVFFVASALYASSTFFEVFTTATIAAIHVIIQVLNKDLGSALIFFVVYICMIYIATGNIFYFILGIGAGSGASVVAYRFFSHVRVRVEAFMDPFAVIDSSGYQITQSLFGISSGGLFGLGLYKGDPDSIPFVTDDFIFSAIAEELGIVFAICLILICLSCFVAFMDVSLKLNDKFYQLVAFGLAVTYIFQVFLTIGGGTKFIPLTGVTLPLVSYGGSSVFTTIIMFAIIEGLYMIREDEKTESLAVTAAKDKGSKKKVKKEERRPTKPEKTKEKIKTNRPNKTKKRPQKYIYDEYEEYSDEEYLEDEEYYDEDNEYDEYEDGADYSVESDGHEPEFEEDFEEDEEDDLNFIKGFTRPIDYKKVSRRLNESDEYDEIGHIYYNEEEYEKDKELERKEKNKKKD